MRMWTWVGHQRRPGRLKRQAQKRRACVTTCSSKLAGGLGSDARAAHARKSRKLCRGKHRAQLEDRGACSDNDANNLAASFVDISSLIFAGSVCRDSSGNGFDTDPLHEETFINDLLPNMRLALAAVMQPAPSA